MNYTVQELALQYAEAVVAFHEAVLRYNANDDIDAALVRAVAERQQARDDMFAARDRLDAAAKRQAELNERARVSV